MELSGSELKFLIRKAPTLPMNEYGLCYLSFLFMKKNGVRIQTAKIQTDFKWSENIKLIDKN